MVAFESIAVTGLSCICAAGNSTELVFNNLLAAQSDSRQLASGMILGEQALNFPFFAVSDTILKRKPGGSAADTLYLAQYVAQKAIEQAQIDMQDLGIVFGTTAGSALHFLQGYKNIKNKTSHLAKDIAEYFSSNLALSLADKFNSSGPVLTLTNACTSGADALGMALDLIRTNQCKAVLCGGADALSLVPHAGFARLMIYDAQPCRPYDQTRQGLNLGEGAAGVVLESEAQAMTRGAKILGYVRGYGSANDAYHFTAPHPGARGLQAAIEQAMSEAQITAQDLAFINVHGTATPENDKVEGRLVAKLFPQVHVWASKGSTGHTLGAAGALEAVLCLLALQARQVPASIGFTQMDPEIKICPQTMPLTISKKYALSLSLGFGGGNAALVLEGTCQNN